MDLKERQEALLALAMLLEFSQLDDEGRRDRAKEYDAMGLGYVAHSFVTLDEQESIVEGLIVAYKRTGDPAALWAMGKATASLSLPRLSTVLRECDSMDEAQCWQAACALEVLLDDAHIPEKLRSVLVRFSERLFELDSARLERIGHRIAQIVRGER